MAPQDNPFRLRELTLSGFKSIKITDTPILFADLTVLIGANGAGKSNLLSFFEMLNYMSTERLERYVTTHGGPDTLLHNGVQNTRELSAELIFKNTEEATNRYNFMLTLFQGYKDELHFTKEQVDFREAGRTNKNEPFRLKVGRTESAIHDPQCAHNKTVRFFKHLLSGLRFFQFHDTSATSPLRRPSARITGNRPQIFSNGGNLPYVLWYLHEECPDEYSFLAKTLRRILPIFREFTFDISTNEKDGNEYVNATWNATGQEMSFGIHQFSDGSLRFIVLMALLLLPDGFLPSTIIIDEPELGLHPKALSILAALMKVTAKKTQIICATQSPEFLSNFDLQNVLVIDCEDGKSVFQKPNKKELAVWLQDYALGEIWNKNLIGGRP